MKSSSPYLTYKIQDRQILHMLLQVSPCSPRYGSPYQSSPVLIKVRQKSQIDATESYPSHKLLPYKIRPLSQTKSKSSNRVFSKTICSRPASHILMVVHLQGSSQHAILLFLNRLNSNRTFQNHLQITTSPNLSTSPSYREEISLSLCQYIDFIHSSRTSTESSLTDDVIFFIASLYAWNLSVAQNLAIEIAEVARQRNRTETTLTPCSY